MSTGKITLMGQIDVPKDRLTEVSAALPLHIKLSRAETGCLIFNVTPNPDHKGRFDVYEEFSNRATFDAHQKRVASSAWGQITQGIPRSYEQTEDS